MILKGLVNNSNRIESASISRIQKHRARGESGTISAFRSFRDDFYDLPVAEQNAIIKNPDSEDYKKYKITYAENMRRTRNLKKLMNRFKDQIGYIQIDGMYHEAGAPNPSSETSFFVYTLDPKFKLRKTLVNLGRAFNQDSVTYSEANGKDYELICTTNQRRGIKSDGKIYKHGQTICILHGEAWGHSGLFREECYSKIRGRPFAWTNYKVTHTADSTMQAYKTLERNSYHLEKSPYLHTKLHKRDTYGHLDKLLSQWGAE